MLLAADFNELIRTDGQRCSWRRSFACPCASPTSGAASTTCRFCSGSGRLWEEPIDTVMAKSGSNVVKKWAQMGMYDEGDSVFTIGSDSPAYAIAAFDRVLMTDQTEPFSFNVTPGVNARFNFTTAVVEKVLVMDTGRLVNWSLPEVDQSGRLTWPQGAPPGTYSITGRRNVEFFAFTNQPFDRPHEHGEPLPRRIVMRRFDLFSRGAT